MERLSFEESCKKRAALQKAQILESVATCKDCAYFQFGDGVDWCEHHGIDIFNGDVCEEFIWEDI